MLSLLTRWKDSKNILKYLLVIFIGALLAIEAIRLFIHNITTKLGWWMWIAGVAMASVFFMLSMYYETGFMDTLMKFMETISNI